MWASGRENCRLELRRQDKLEGIACPDPNPTRASHTRAVPKILGADRFAGSLPKTRLTCSPSRSARFPSSLGLISLTYRVMPSKHKKLPSSRLELDGQSRTITV